jgi:hypothetical protein
MQNDIHKQSVGFAQIANEVLNDRSLSFKAKGIYAFMFSKPDRWNFTIRSMAKQVKDGEDGIKSGIQELKKLGYIKYEKHRDGSGTYHLNVTRSPKVENPVKASESHKGKSPRREIPLKGKSTRISNKEPGSNKDSISNKYSTGRFEEFWQAYPRKVKKIDAKKKWKAKQLDRIADQLIADVLKRAAGDKSWLEGFTPHPTTYISQERWNDEIESPTRYKHTTSSQLGSGLDVLKEAAR